MWFISLVMKNLYRRKVRSILTCTSMAIAVCAVLSMLGTAEGYEQSFAALFEARGTDIVVNQAGKAQRISSYLDESLAAEIKKIPGVRDVEGTLVDLASYPEINLYAVYFFGIDPNSTLVEGSKIIEGEPLAVGDHRKLAMGHTLARNLGKKLGDTVEVAGELFVIKTIFKSPNHLESNGAAVPLKEFQKLLGKEGKVTTFLVMLELPYKTPEKVEGICREIEALKGNGGAKLHIEAQSTRDNIKTNMETQALKGLAWAASLIAILIGFVSMLNTMMMSITERVREIATFRAIGWRKMRIMRMIFLESLVLSLIGAALGVLLAIPLMEFLANFSMTSSLVVSRITLDTFCKGVGMGLIAGLLGAIYPAFIAANLSPASALRHE